MTEKLPDGSTLVRTTDDLQDAIDAARSGDCFVLATGVHKIRRPIKLDGRAIIRGKRRKKRS